MYEQTCDANSLEWVAAPIPGVEYKMLSTDPITGAHLMLYRFAPGSEVPQHMHTHAAETAYVLDGDFVEGGTSYGPGQSFYCGPGTPHGPHRTVRGSLVLFQLSAALDFNVV